MTLHVRLLERGTNPEQTREFPIDGPEFLIGRATDCNLRLRGSAISRHHCIIRLGADEVTLVDLGSSNGSYVNGQRVVSQAALHSGDVLRLGERDFLVDLGDSAISLGGAEGDPLAATLRLKKK
jgi:pSer/pThr/pTyr-binding forkhead associated (FHA) protein